MAKKKLKTVVALVLDESGSMNLTKDDTIGAINEYFDSLKKDAPDALVSIMKFDAPGDGTDKFRVLCSGVSVADVPQLTEKNYKPRGATPLYDAIGKAITETEEVKADRYLLVVMTDGYENASTEYTLDTIKKMIEAKQKENWTIVYLGANQDAWAVGTAMGIAAGSTMSYAQTGAGIHQTASSLSMATSTLTSSPRSSTETFFSDAGQTEADYQDPSEKKNSRLWTPKKN